MFSWLKEWFEGAVQWLWDQVLAILAAIPVPEWLSDASGLWAAIPAPVLFFMQALKLPEGLLIIGAAYVIRFLIRRIPIIG